MLRRAHCSHVKSAGVRCLYIAEVAPSETDESILAQANREERIVITEDRDFCELVFRDAKPTYGIILVRIPVPHRLRKADRITELVEKHLDELPGAMTTVMLARIKIRPLRKQA